MSECVSLSRPTRVLSVIPVTGAPILHGKATTPTHHRSLDSHRKAPTPSQNQLPHRPPGQKTVLEEYFRFQLSDLRFLFMSSNDIRFQISDRLSIHMPALLSIHRPDEFIMHNPPPSLPPGLRCYPTRYSGNRRKSHSTHLCVGAFPSVSPSYC